VRHIFALYRELGGVRRVKEEADRLGLRTKCSATANGAARGGSGLSRGHIYQLLSNPIYTGQIAHKGQLYPGQHPALIDARDLEYGSGPARCQFEPPAIEERCSGTEPFGGAAVRC